MYTTDQLRQSFLDFFEERGHTVVPSAPLVPDDPSLLFTVAGMVQFKPLFAGTVELPYRRAASSQKCLRAGGKDSDLANVGHTLRHHTFFEMLGNFSFGDYFKKEGIPWAWEYMTEVAKLDPERLYATVYTDDDEAAGIWLNDVGLPPERLARYEEDNFWGPAGGVGACGPSSEIHYLVGDHMPCDNPDCHINCDCDRWLEIYNIVFPQFDQQPDGSRKPLKNRGIDTGMGLERLAVAAQDVDSNFLIDIWKPVIDRACSIIDKEYRSDPHVTSSVNIVADHTRALSFCIAENILPGNEGRGYVVRKILRRALLHTYLLGHNEPMLYELVEPIVEKMGGAYPDLKKREEFIAYTIREEETKYLKTLSRGMDRLQNILQGVKKGDCISGDDAFKLYDTYGLPIEVTREVADWDGIETDDAGFEAAMAQQKHRSKKASTFAIDFPLLEGLADLQITEFVGSTELTVDAKILAIVAEKGREDSLSEGQQGIVVLDITPFYAEAGGQAGDTGFLATESGSFDVGETSKNAAGIYLHYGTLAKGEIKVGDTVDARVDAELRANIERHHTATHLLHAALREVLGEGAT
ncbi:MAG: alanine--tRNA ligase, partial [bacterium]|nr:alanine--tRNA ligase [bacterium]